MLESHSGPSRSGGLLPQPAPIPAGAVVDVVRLDLLEAVSTGLLVRFLRPWEVYLGTRGIRLDEASSEAYWLERIYAVLNSVDAKVPGDLQQALIDVSDLANESAHDQLLDIARQQQLELFKINGRTTVEDLAFAVYLDHQDLFRAAHVRTQSGAVDRYVEYLGKDSTSPASYKSKGKHALLARALSAAFRERNRTGYCHIQLVEAKGEIRFVIIHGRPPCSRGAIETEERRGRITYVPDKHDTIVFQKQTHRLLVNAQYATEQDLYRRLFGRIFWQDESHFRIAPVYTGKPLIELGAAALRTHGVAGLQKAVLKRIDVECTGNNGSAQYCIHGHDVGAELDSPRGREIRQCGDVRGFRLDLVLQGHRAALPVDVRVPNHLKYDRRRGADIVEEYLQVAGFMHLPVLVEGASP